ncbi:MAG: YihY/virulence factor BrkB family protein [Devosia sp.]
MSATKEPSEAEQRLPNTDIHPDKLPYHERLRGRNARNPVQIGWRGWLDILVRVFKRVPVDQLGLVTAGATFYLFLALLPAMIAVVTFYGIIANSATLEAHVAFLEGYLPDQAIAWFGGELKRLSDVRHSGVTLTFAISLGVSLWSMNNAVLALFGAMNIAYGEAEKRGTISLYLRSFAFTLIALVVGLLVVASIVVLPLALGAAQDVGYGGRRVSAPIMFIVVAVGSAAIFRVGPSRKPAKWRWIAVGAISVATGWLAAAILLSWYLSNVANYAIIYGSLGTVIALMFWMYISVFILLLGAELNAEVERQTLVDTTEGPPAPLGERGAYVADSIGKPVF